MIEDRVIQISEHGTSRMLFGNQWIAREAPKRGLRDPWAHRPDGILETKEVTTEFMGKPIKSTQVTYRDYTEEEMAAWKIERDEYMRQRDEWIALQMFNKYGYEQFCLECEFNNLSDDFWRSVRPCESLCDSQCNLFCTFYEDCALRFAETQNGGKNYENREC